MEAGAVLCHWGRVRLPAEMNEAWRGFWRHDTDSRAYTSTAVQVDNGAWNLSWYRI
jgi:hypothetical protein